MREPSRRPNSSLIDARNNPNRGRSTLSRGDEEMRNVRHGVKGVLVGLAVLAAAFAVSPASAEERGCRGALGAVTVDNLRVPQNATCRLNRTVVKGTIKVERNATLVAQRIRVVGRIQAENARNVVVTKASRVGGNVQVKQGGAATVTSSRINGDI